MSRSLFEVFTFRSIGDAIAHALQLPVSPECRVVNGRVTLTFRRLGAARWPEMQQMELVHRAVGVARGVLADDSRRQLRRGAARAIVVVFEDASLVQGCAVTARWECALPAQS
jgi:hypothetical protein